MQIIFLILILTTMAFGQDTWTVSRQEIIAAPQATPGRQQIPLSIILEEGTIWTSELKAHLDKANKIFHQCGIEFGAVEVSYVKLAKPLIESMKKPDPYKGPAELNFMKGEVSATRPLIFLLGKQTPSGAKAFNATSVKKLSSWKVDASPLLNTTFITEQHHSHGKVPGSLPSYNTLAHELAHLFGDFDHINEMDNLMSNFEKPGSKSGRLNPHQCKQIQSHLLTWSFKDASGEDCP